MSDIQHRIVEIRTSLSLNQSKFAEALGVKRPTLIGYETGKSPPSSEFFQKLRRVFNVDMEWLLEGVGTMFRSDSQIPEREKDNSGQIHNSCEFGNQEEFCEPVEPFDSKNATGAFLPPGAIALRRSEPGEIRDVGETASRLYSYPEDVTVYRYQKGSLEPVEIKEPDITGMVFIPVYSQCAAAGPGQPPTQLQETEGKMPLVYDLFGSHNPKNCGICRVVGDSMTDITLSNGDWVIFDRADTSGDGIFVISMYGEVRVKRLQYRIADQKIVIASENTRRYPEPEIVSADAITKGNLIIYGRVFSWMHKHPY
jgi:SOS-response transcriptional repressor LexA/DNA-binding XRE family transcriptional regulator